MISGTIFAEPVSGGVVDPGSFRIAVAVQGHLAAQRSALGYRAFKSHTAYVSLTEQWLRLF
jgi:hypothetical protein